MKRSAIWAVRVDRGGEIFALPGLSELDQRRASLFLGDACARLLSDFPRYIGQRQQAKSVGQSLKAKYARLGVDGGRVLP